MPLLTAPTRIDRRTGAPGGSGSLPGHRMAPVVVARLSLIDPDLADRLLTACAQEDLPALSGLLADASLREAIETASPSLGAEVDRFLEGTCGPQKRKRMVQALFRYGLRSRYRATPLGLFAGVGVLRPGEPVPAYRAGSVRRVIRPSASWCAAVCADLSADDEALLDLLVTASRAVYGRKDELIALRRDTDGGQGLAVTRHVPLMRGLLADCAGFRPVREVVALVARRTGCAAGQAERFVLQMIRHGLLVTELADVETDPMPWDRLRETVLAVAARGGTGWPGWRPVAAGLTGLADLLAATPADAPVPVGRYRELNAALRAVHEPSDLHVDAILGGQAPAAAPPQDAVYAACRALAVISPIATGRVLGSLSRWFGERYSDSHTVRLPELFLPGSGFDLGAATARPDGVHPGNPGSTEDPPAWTRAVESLGLLERGPEVDVLPLLAKSDLRAAADALPPAFVAFVRSAPAGDSPSPFHLRNLTAGLQLLGRFGHLDADLLEVLRRFVAVEESHDGDAVRADVRCPCVGRSHNIAQRPPLRRVAIDFGAPTRGADVFGRPIVSLPVEDLLVRVADGEIRLYSEQLGRRVLPSVASAVVPHRCAYPLAGFLTLLSGQLSQTRHWSWRSLGRLPELPRITAGGVVLAPRQWTVTAAEVEALSDRAGGRATAARLPRFLAVGGGENQLLIDTASPLGIGHLRREARQAAGRLVVQEAWSQPADWPGTEPRTRPAELVLPFHRPPADRTRGPARPAPAVRGQVPRGPLPRYGPGSPWASVKVYGRPERLDDLLAGLAPLISTAHASGDLRRWFFVRYADPDTHLRLRFRGHPQRLWGVFLPQLWRELDAFDRYWDRSLVDEYRPEIDRYGGPRGLVHAERLFTADSDLAVRLCGADETARLASAVVSTHRLLCATGLPLNERRRLVAGIERARAERHGVEAARVEAGRRDRSGGVRLDEPPAAEPLGAEPLDAEPLDAWTASAVPAVERIRALLEPDRDALAAVVASLLHMHANRMFPVRTNYWEVAGCSLVRRCYDRALRRAAPPAGDPGA